MYIAAIQIELSIPWAQSLKDKRRAIKGLKEKIQNKFHVSAAEVGENEIWRRSIIGVAAVANEQKYLQSLSQKIVNFVDDHADTVLDDFSIEII